jgi:hypothetical protein
MVPAIPPFDTYGDKTAVEGVSWSPDGRWIAFLTEPGVGHGVTDAKLFLVPATGGHMKVLVDLCSQMPAGRPLWTADSKDIFIAKEDENYERGYFQVDIATGKQTAISEHELPAIPPAPLPVGAEQPHLAQDGRFLYFQLSDRTKTRLVASRGLGRAGHQ